ncbi:hypothetical protein ETD83_02405 [Actinomadura soli]|uniref:Uncharacterized protein n=1 Tax=Actinomadura soli TaxID=2508997 RepID=A0A5C4JLS8_9ACTN|nr:hypothetical protein [Actinomadura soli]TMR07011.1 hypothetical protein ETD83_02405 [Actinomadura soli]
MTVSPPRLHGTIAPYGTADEARIEGRFDLEPIGPEAARIQQSPLGGLLERALNVDPKGMLKFGFGEFRVSAVIAGRKWKRIQVLRNEQVLPAVVECDELLGRLDELVRAVSPELNRLAGRTARGPVEKAVRHWRMARLHLGLGRFDSGGAEAEKGLGALRHTTSGGPLTDPHLRELGEELVTLLDEIDRPSEARRIRELLDDAGG